MFRHKLHKLLFFADLLQYQETGEGISGLSYFHRDFGPVPERGDLLYEVLVLQGFLQKREMRFPASDYYGTAFEAGDRALPVRNEDEQELLERIVLAYKQATPEMLIQESLSIPEAEQPPFLIR